MVFILLPVAIFIPRAWRGKAVDGLTMVRILFLSYMATVFGFLIVVVVAMRYSEPETAPPWMVPAFAAALLTARGSSLSLGRALMEAPASGPVGR